MVGAVVVVVLMKENSEGAPMPADDAEESEEDWGWTVEEEPTISDAAKSQISWSSVSKDGCICQRSSFLLLRFFYVLYPPTLSVDKYKQSNNLNSKYFDRNSLELGLIFKKKRPMSRGHN